MNQNEQHQKGAPQDTADMPSSGNSPAMTGAERGSEEAGTDTGDVERSGAAAASPRGVNMAGDPGRTPGSAEGVEGFQETGNE